jgi:diadenosine tetraphosphate (Ap4A) HIT family hydrolase
MEAREVAGCPFCDDRAAGRNVVREAGPYFFRWDRYPVSEGHLLVIPKRHVEWFSELSLLESQSLGPALNDAVQLVRAKVNPDAVNVGINDGPAAGQTVPHLHVHVIPRWSGDVEDPRGGVRGVIPARRRY